VEIRLTKDVQKRLEESIQRYCAEDLGCPVGDLQAGLFLKFCLAEIAPSVYNQAIADAQAFLQEKLGDLENTCFVPEFGHWREPSAAPGRRRAGFRP